MAAVIEVTPQPNPTVSISRPGPQGPPGPPGSGFVVRGAWAPSTAYALNDLVTNNGSTYRVTTAHTSGTTFSTTNLAAVAEKGAAGSPGPIGPAGPAGASGTPGATGPQGPAGLGFNPRGAWTAFTTYAVNDIVTNSGTTYRVVTDHTSPSAFSAANLEAWATRGGAGPEGPAGAPGAQGPAPDYSNVPAGMTFTIQKTGSTWPARFSSRADLHFIWKGPDPSPAIVTSGTGGMLDNVDSRWITT